MIFEIGQLITVHPNEELKSTEYVIFRISPPQSLWYDQDCLIFLQEIGLNGDRCSMGADRLTTILAKAPQPFITVPSKRPLYKSGDFIDLMPMPFYMCQFPTRITKWYVDNIVRRRHSDSNMTARLRLVEDDKIYFSCDEVELYIFDALCRHVKNVMKSARRKRNREEAAQRKKDFVYHEPFQDKDDDYTLSHRLFL